MRYTCNEIHIKQYKQLRTLFTLLCLKSHNIYYFNILRMIKLFYHLYVKHEMYSMPYKEKIQFHDDFLYIQNGIHKWDDYITWDERLINMGY